MPDPVPTWRRRAAFAPPAFFTLGWIIYVATTEQWDRIVTVWRTTVTMIFGSFVAGSTPQGGGAVAFPVFTKILEVDASVARTFSLSIQATGMVMASLTILIAGRQIDRRAILWGTIGGLAGFAIGALLLSDPSALWWAPRLPAAWIKVGFTIAIAALALIIRACFTGGTDGHDRLDRWSRRTIAVVLGFTSLGGVTSALAGSGADVLLFIFLVLIGGVHPRVAIPSSIITMAIVSVAGFVLFGVVDGQLATVVDSSGVVIGAGDATFDPPLDPARFDLFGIWLGAAPIVVWGAPLGSWVASVLREKHLIGFVLFMALAEIATTIIFLDALRTDRALAAFGVAGLVAAAFAVRLLGRAKRWILAGG